MTLQEIARLVRSHESALHQQLAEARAGLFRFPDGSCQVIGDLELGSYPEGAETIYIFANQADLDAFFRFVDGLS